MSNVRKPPVCSAITEDMPGRSAVPAAGGLNIFATAGWLRHGEWLHYVVVSADRPA